MVDHYIFTLCFYFLFHAHSNTCEKRLLPFTCPSVCLSIFSLPILCWLLSLQLPQDFQEIMILGKICQEHGMLVEIMQKFRVLYLKTLIHCIVSGNIKITIKVLFDCSGVRLLRYPSVSMYQCLYHCTDLCEILMLVTSVKICVGKFQIWLKLGT